MGVEGYIIDNKYELLDDTWDLQDREKEDDCKQKLPIQKAIQFIGQKLESCRHNAQQLQDHFEMVDYGEGARDPNLRGEYHNRHTLDETKHPIQLMVINLSRPY